MSKYPEVYIFLDVLITISFHNPGIKGVFSDTGYPHESGSTRPRVKSARVSSAGSTRPAIFGVWVYGCW